MTGVEIASIILGSGLLSGVITTLLTQLHQRRENRFDPRRQAYAELLAAMDTFFRRARELRHERTLDELRDAFGEVLADGSPLDAPLSQVRLLAPQRTVEACDRAVRQLYGFLVAESAVSQVTTAREELVALMRKDLGSVA